MTTPKTPPKILEEIETQILELINQNNRITKSEIGKKFGLSDDGVRYHIRKMTEKKILKWEGTSRRGSWKILKIIENTATKNIIGIETQIIELINLNNRITKSEIGENLGLSEDGVKYHIRKMTEKKILKWVGTSRTGNWKIEKDLTKSQGKQNN